MRTLIGRAAADSVLDTTSGRHFVEVHIDLSPGHTVALLQTWISIKKGEFLTLQHLHAIPDLDPGTILIDEVSEIEGVVVKKEKKEDVEDVKKRSRKPPKDGPCKRCGQNKPLNRLLLCYTCWVKDKLEKSGWREGQAHPISCGCDLECAAERKDFGN